LEPLRGLWNTGADGLKAGVLHGEDAPALHAGLPGRGDRVSPDEREGNITRTRSTCRSSRRTIWIVSVHESTAAHACVVLPMNEIASSLVLGTGSCHRLTLILNSEQG